MQTILKKFRKVATPAAKEGAKTLFWFIFGRKYHGQRGCHWVYDRSLANSADMFVYTIVKGGRMPTIK